MKKKLLCLLALLPALGFSQIWSENFEGEVFPPTGWTLQQQNANQTWLHYSNNPISGTYSASVDYDDALGAQNEWIITPSIDLTGYLGLYLNFTVSMSYYWSVDPNNNYDVTVKVSTDGGQTWTDVWTESDQGVFANWTPLNISADLSMAANAADVKLAFVYTGTDGAQVVLDNISITEDLPPPVFPAPYCTVAGLDTVEAITKVEFAGISNVTPIEDTVLHEDHTTLSANVNIDGTYQISLEGDTAGDYSDFFTVYIDWNQNNIYGDVDNEIYEMGSITNSTGDDGQQASGPITVPTAALEGTTRMRVLKNWDEYAPSACEAGSIFGGYGQAEEYSVNVGPALAVTNFNAAAFNHYPNPVKDVLNVSYNQNISEVKVFNILGQAVLTKSINDTKGQVDMSALPSGNYIAKITSASAVKTIKVIKE